MASEPAKQGEQWGSRLGVILAVAGSAVGLGNFLRFPGKAAENGGGAFMIPYLIALLLIGIPICWVEWTMGRRGGRFGFNSAPGIFRVLWKNPISPYFGAIGLLVPVVIYMYYVYIESWCLLYATFYLTGQFEGFGKNPFAYGEFFGQVTGSSADGAVFANGVQPIVWFFFITFFVNMVFIYRGLTKGIESVCKFAMPMLIVAAIIVAVRIVTLPEQPAAKPWQLALPAALPAEDWEKLKLSLADVPVTADEGPNGRAIVRTAFDDYFKAIIDRDNRINSEVPVAFPAGFLNTDRGFAVAMAELRADEKSAADYRVWITEIASHLSDEQKRSLQKLERREMRLDKKANGVRDQIAQSEKAKADTNALQKELSEVLEQKAKVDDERQTLFGADAPPMPSLGDSLTGLLGADVTPGPVQRRCASIEIAELPRTVSNGLGYMWNPDFGELRNANVWLEAAGQIFFSLSVGFGVILNYASYLRKKDDVVLSGLTASATNEFCEVGLGGLVAIPATFIFLGTATTLDVINSQSSFGLGFNTLPTVFASMPGGRWFAAMWFGLLFLAGITSSLSMLQPAIAFLEEGFQLKRRVSVAWLGMVTMVGALGVVYFSKDSAVLVTMDYWVGTFMIYVLATVQIVIFAWIIGIEEGMREAHLGARIQIPAIFRFIIKYVTPVYLLTIFAAWAIENAPGEIAKIKDAPVRLTVIGLVGFFAFLLLLVHLANREWTRQGRGLKEVES